MSLFGVDAMLEGMAEGAKELVEELQAEKAELLAALRAVMETCAHAETADCSSCRQAYAAIAKAEGRSND